MAVPGLKIPLGLDNSGFQKGIEDTKSYVRQASQFILKQFAEMNAGLGGPAVAGAVAGYGASVLRLVGVFGAVVASAKLVGDAISATRERLAEMVDVASKAQASGVSVEFFQSFVSGAKGAEDRLLSFEGALERAFQATKPLLNPDWSVWDIGLVKVSAVEKAMRETRELFTTDQNFSGFDLFKDATSQDEKIKAVLIYMKQLKAIGQEVAALDIGEKMFGSNFVDKVRTGQESFDRMLRTLQAGSLQTFISNEAAKNAKDLDDRLKDAHATISERLKPDWDDLASAALRIKGVWVSVLEAVAQYHATAIKPAPFVSTTANDSVNDPDPNSAAFGNNQILNQGRRRRGQLPVTLGGAAPSEAAALDAYSSLNDLSGAPPAPERIPLPARRPQDAPPPPPPPPPAARDPFEVTIDNINKRIAALKAETATIDAGTEAQERAKAVGMLEEAAKRANTAAGLANTDVTAKQRVEIEKEADALAKVAVAAEKARIASSIRFDSKTALLTSEDVAIANQLKGIYPDVATALGSVEATAIRVNNANKEIANVFSTNMTTGIVDVIDGTKTAGQAFQDFSKIVIRAMEEAIVKLLIVGPLMRSLQSGFGGLFGGALPGFGTPSFIGPLPGNAAGTDNWRGGPTWVGENGPEIVNLPRGAQVVPNDVARLGGGGSVTNITYSIDASGADPAAISRLERVLQSHSQQIALQNRSLQNSQYTQATGVGR